MSIISKNVKLSQARIGKKEANEGEPGRLFPPFGYFGSKSKIASYICDNLPPHNAWVEAFCGSAALTLAKSPAPIEVINDIDSQITNLFRQLRNHPRKLCKLVALTPYSREEFQQAHQPIRRISGLEKARRFLICSMMAINGAFGKDNGGFSYSLSYTRQGKEARVSRWYNLPERIEAIVERLRKVRVENMDARKLVKLYADRPATLIYLDPPYLGGRAKGYNRDQGTESFHVELLELAQRSKSMIFVSGYDHELYHTLLSPKRGWRKRIIETSTRDVTGCPTRRTEILWMNKQFQNAKILGRPPLRLSKTESAEHKVNPARK